VGGGVVSDIAGFVASVYLRGVPLVIVPTTLLAQIDAAIGGKNAVNTTFAKNLVGTFYQPVAIIIDTNTLRTLPAHEMANGFAEAIKYSVIEGKNIKRLLTTKSAALTAKDHSALIALIVACVLLKGRIVQKDERETPNPKSTVSRSILNYGHTIGHCIEHCSGYRVAHGTAVCVGMNIEARIANALALCTEQFVREQANLIKSFDLPLSPGNISAERLLSVMRFDKKVQRGATRFALPAGWGRVVFPVGVELNVIRAVLEGIR
jgi:3-dehydroquinate synthase